MPNRIIRDSIRTSDTLAGISAEAERLFWRLVVSADDHGCFYGDPGIILGQAMTAFIRRGVTEADIAAWLKELEAAGLVRRYEADGRLYLHIITWHRHQRTPRGKPKYPLPSWYDPQQVMAGRGESRRSAAGRGESQRVAASRGELRLGIVNREIVNRESSSDDAANMQQADGGAAPAAETGGRGDADSPSLSAGSAVALEVAAAVRDADPDLRPVHDAYFEVTGRALMPGRDIETLRELLQIATPEQIAAAIREVGARARDAGTRPRSLRYFADAVREAVARSQKPLQHLDYELPDPDSEMERRRAERAKWWREQMAAKAKGRAPA